MVIHLAQIPSEGLHLEGEEPMSVPGLNEPNVVLVTPVAYAIDVGISGGGVFATGVLEAEFELECVSCLRKFRYPVRVDEFAVQEEFAGGEAVDLTPHVREDIVLALPPHPHCNWDGEKKCPGARKIPTEPVEERSHLWDALDDLKLEGGKR